MGSGLLAGVAVSGRVLGGLPGWMVLGLGFGALGTGFLAWRRIAGLRAQEQTHWAGQVGRLLQSMGKSDDSVAVLDGARRLLWAGQGYCRAEGRTLSQLLGRPVDLMAWAGIEAGTEDQAKLQEVVRAGGSWHGECGISGTDGTVRRVEQWVQGIRGAQGGVSHYLGIRRDAHTTERCLEELRKANQAMEGRLLQATSEFGEFNRELEKMFFGLGHQLRGAQIGMTEVKVALGVERPESIPANVRRELEWMMRSGARLMRLVECLGWLHELRGKPLEMERLDLSAMAGEILRGFAEAEPGRSIQTSVEPGTTGIGDARLIRVMLGNLLGNAWKFSRANPNARIEFGRVDRPEGRQTFFVRDNGIGLDRSWVGKMLAGGSLSGYLEESSDARLGLVVVQRIVERHRGEVWAEAQAGGGVEFRFTLG